MRLSIPLALVVAAASGCAATSSRLPLDAPIEWRSDERLLTFRGEDVALAVPRSWRVTPLYPGAYLYTFAAGRLQVAWDTQRLDERGAARRVRGFVERFEGRALVDAPPTGFSAERGGVSVRYTAPDGRKLLAVHRSFACGGLQCHATLLIADHQREEGEWNLRTALAYVGAIPVVTR